MPRDRKSYLDYRLLLKLVPDPQDIPAAMNDYSQDQWYQVFDEAYDTYNPGSADSRLDCDEAEFDYDDYHSQESVNDQRDSLWDHSWADGNPRSEAIVAQAQELIAALWRLVDEKDIRLQLEVPGTVVVGA